LKKYIQSYVFLFPIAGIIVVLDQWTKHLVRANISYGGSWMPWEWLRPIVRIVHWSNTGAAFGLGQDFSIVFTILAIFVSGAIIFYFPQIADEEWPLRIALALQLGGALGNLTDRLTRGVVTDFVQLQFFPAVFNVADACITAGCVVLIIGMWILDRKEKAAALEAEASGLEGDSHSLFEEMAGE
jgi:signal peptidase II